MPLTPIPEHQIHSPEEVELNAKRFDFLCRLTEGVAYPIVYEVLYREFNETNAAGAELLTNEARQALEALAEEAAILEDLDEDKVLEEFRKSLDAELPAPDEFECRQHTRNFSSMLVSAWLETLRSAPSEFAISALSDQLLPEAVGLSWLMEKFGAKRKLRELADDVGWFGLKKDDIGKIMTALRGELFPEPRRVDLPFNLVMMGTPKEPVLVMQRSLYERLIEELRRQTQLVPTTEPTIEPVPSFPQPPAYAVNGVKIAAVNIVAEPVPKIGYTRFAKMASVKTANVEQRVQQALAAIGQM